MDQEDAWLMYNVASGEQSGVRRLIRSTQLNLEYETCRLDYEERRSKLSSTISIVLWRTSSLECQVMGIYIYRNIIGKMKVRMVANRNILIS